MQIGIKIFFQLPIKAQVVVARTLEKLTIQRAYLICAGFRIAVFTECPARSYSCRPICVISKCSPTWVHDGCMECTIQARWNVVAQVWQRDVGTLHSRYTASTVPDTRVTPAVAPSYAYGYVFVITWQDKS